jgi:hypothetical protein
LIWLAAGLLLVIPAAVFPAYWETGLLGQHRTVNTAYFAFLVLWFTATAIWVAGDGRHAHALRQFSNQFRVPLAILLLAALAVTHNSYALGLFRAARSASRERRREVGLLRHVRH